MTEELRKVDDALSKVCGQRMPRGFSHLHGSKTLCDRPMCFQALEDAPPQILIDQRYVLRGLRGPNDIVADVFLVWRIEA